MEDKQKKRVRFNVFDLVIILIVAAVGVGVLALRNRAAGADVGRETVPMRCTVEFLKTTPGMAEAMHEGDSVYYSIDGAYLGKLAEFRAVPHVETEFLPATGAFVQYECEEFIDLYMTIEGDCYATARNVMFGSVPIKVGTELAVKGRGYAKLGYVVALDPMGAEIPQNTEPSGGDGEALYTIRLDDARSFYAENIHVGDRFYETKTGGMLGIVQNVSVEPYSETHLCADGEAYRAEKPDRYAVYIQLKGGFVSKPDGYYLGGVTELKTGGLIAMESQYIARTGIFSSLESIEDAA